MLGIIFIHAKRWVFTWDLFDRVLGANTGMFGPLLSIVVMRRLKHQVIKSIDLNPLFASWDLLQ